jgi:hypothetical protein
MTNRLRNLRAYSKSDASLIGITLAKKVKMSIPIVPVYKVSQLPQKSQNVKSNYASLESVT